MKNLRSYFVALLAVLLLGSNFAEAQTTTTTTTTTKKPWSKTAKGALIGAGGGAVVGGVLGRVIGGKNSTAGGAIIGAAVGGGAGALIGRRMDKQAAELKREMAGARVERVGEGIKITFDSGLLFAKNSAALTASAQENIADLAKTLIKYNDTNVLVEGHTDTSGSDAINDPLSQRRAQAVANYAQGQGVDASRFTVTGYGSKQPVADNSTEAGRIANRRVEVAIYANEKLKKAAEKGTI
ncbi:Outer membrane protein OmpA [Hymenobacter daecheongensis DSM 21074]|uniref:Outer membrane protein OmpA n=1 Tax=Hymenobacter daecheongensis DSM 21074 TaxID=1121955 RepID=A0A1M6CQ29_9BACT|nr:OmpA family protein [Hymenobacter daecheongensis]SHI63122.1 Outer membrane protein OmpA [Hymenobacter daecheongensis DSM 21074]